MGGRSHPPTPPAYAYDLVKILWPHQGFPDTFMPSCLRSVMNCGKGMFCYISTDLLLSKSYSFLIQACDFYFNVSDVLISYLPMAHLYEQGAQCIMYTYGCRIGFFRGDVKLLLADIAELKPTFFPAVPRVLNKIYDQVYELLKIYNLLNAP
jgi:hypothetical protein